MSDPNDDSNPDPKKPDPPAEGALAGLRQRLDDVDRQLLDALASRQRLIGEASLREAPLDFLRDLCGPGPMDVLPAIVSQRLLPSSISPQNPAPDKNGDGLLGGPRSS